MPFTLHDSQLPVVLHAKGTDLGSCAKVAVKMPSLTTHHQGFEVTLVGDARFQLQFTVCAHQTLELTPLLVPWVDLDYKGHPTNIPIYASAIRVCAWQHGHVTITIRGL